MWRGVPVILMAAAVGGAVASCDDPSPPPSLESFCGGVCQGAVRCDNSVPLQICNSSCTGDSATRRSLAVVRPEAAAVVGACLSSDLACEMIFSGPFDACWDRARSETPPSPRLVTFCQEYATWAFNCGYSLSVEDCRTGLNIQTDAFLDEMAACTRLASCEATDACLNNLFGNI